MSLELQEQYEKIYAFCYFKVHNREVAEDITQETFLKYFETTQYLEKGKKLAFLYTIARNCCNDYFRKTKQTTDIDDFHELSQTTWKLLLPSKLLYQS
ncbi:MAG: RNA polymerase sigma factor [Lachnospiraceae bacterium]